MCKKSKTPGNLLMFLSYIEGIKQKSNEPKILKKSRQNLNNQHKK